MPPPPPNPGDVAGNPMAMTHSGTDQNRAIDREAGATCGGWTVFGGTRRSPSPRRGRGEGWRPARTRSAAQSSSPRRCRKLFRLGFAFASVPLDLEAALDVAGCVIVRAGCLGLAGGVGSIRLIASGAVPGRLPRTAAGL